MAGLIRRVGSIPGLGSVGVVISDRGLVFIEVHAWTDQPAMSHRREGVTTGDHPIIDATFNQIAGFILGRQRDFSIACDFTGLPPAKRAAMETMRKVPWGEKRTYAQVATAAGLGPEAVRSLPEALFRNPLPLVIPCHRAVDRDNLGHFVGGSGPKRQLLALEGIDVRSLPDPVGPPSTSWFRR